MLRKLKSNQIECSSQAIDLDYRFDCSQNVRRQFSNLASCCGIDKLFTCQSADMHLSESLTAKFERSSQSGKLVNTCTPVMRFIRVEVAS
ncbi:hypothetical protein TNCT_69571 [Trichonephila clavata]|uniref:Uncharacterized protein n=1 Tax=Trichonephila clavata TaxID=2740835 RepID=A0A8X6G3H7_TRICU|nr:hypothetical protein TNCT_69571 [Trichonephila clavata]